MRGNAIKHFLSSLRSFPPKWDSAPKGHDMSAQGNALGDSAQRKSKALKGRNTPPCAGFRSPCVALSGLGKSKTHGDPGRRCACPGLTCCAPSGQGPPVPASSVFSRLRMRHCVAQVERRDSDADAEHSTPNASRRWQTGPAWRCTATPSFPRHSAHIVPTNSSVG